MARQSSAKASTAVRIRSRPQKDYSTAGSNRSPSVAFREGGRSRPQNLFGGKFESLAAEASRAGGRSRPLEPLESN